MFQFLIAGRGFVLIIDEDAYRHQLSARRCLRQRVGHLVETPWNVVELKAVKLVLQLVDFLVVCSHLGAVAARLLHDLVDDQLGVTPDVEAPDTKLEGDA